MWGNLNIFFFSFFPFSAPLICLAVYTAIFKYNCILAPLWNLHPNSQVPSKVADCLCFEVPPSTIFMFTRFYDGCTLTLLLL